MNYQRSPFDVPADDECPTCEGRGYTPQTAQRSRIVGKKYVTEELGYGCTGCLGTGRRRTSKAER